MKPHLQNKTKHLFSIAAFIFYYMHMNPELYKIHAAIKQITNFIAALILLQLWFHVQ